MKLTPKRRAELRAMFGGRCAYCGHQLPEKGWHADHIEPVLREWWGKEKGKMYHAQRDCIENLFPSCRACNLDKHAMNLETWRRSLEDRAGVCRRNHSAFRHAERFGRVVVVEGPLRFWFEKVAATERLLRAVEGRR